MICILGIETSCDETAAAVVQDGRLVRSNIIASQHELHGKYLGVVPEIASRAHLERIGPVIQEALDTAGLTLEQIEAVAVGNRPGLIGSLLVGVSAAKALAWALNKPLLGMDHVQAHLYAASLRTSDFTDANVASPEYPALGLVVSGGHTSLYEVTGPTVMRRIGRTIDDAAGEAYDKAAVILNLGFPGGPKLDRLAQRGRADARAFPRAMLGTESLDFSFSGLKTALLYAVRGKPTGRGAAARFEREIDDLSDDQRSDLAASFQAAAVHTLVAKLERAHEFLSREGRPPRCLIIGGGVSANSWLRSELLGMGRRYGLPIHLPQLAYCLDNAAMIAGLAFEYFRQRRFDDLHLPVIATTAS